MIALLASLLRAFYWIAIPPYILLYFMASRDSGYSAFWYEGGASKFGPAAFLLLNALWVIPTFLGIALSAAGYGRVLSWAMTRALILSWPCIVGLFPQKPGDIPIIVIDGWLALYWFLMMGFLLFICEWAWEPNPLDECLADLKIQKTKASEQASKAPESIPTTSAPQLATSALTTPPKTHTSEWNLSISRNGQVIMTDITVGNVPTLIMQGILQPTDQYWTNGMTNWLPLSSLTYSHPHTSPLPKERNLTSKLLSLLVSWLITVIIGALVLGLVGYGNSGADGAGRLIGTYIGLLLFVRPVFLVIEIITRAIMGKRGIDLLAP